MKTKSNKTQKSGLSNRPEQLGTKPESKKSLPKISIKRRYANRALNTNSLLALLRNEAPRLFELAEVVGKWVWITFGEKQPSTITSVLAELGFHWNNTRQTWQHPCGTRNDERANYNPRTRYGSYFPADAKRA